MTTKPYDKQLRELGMLSLTKRRTKGNMSVVFQYLRVCHREKGVNLFFKACEGRQEVTNGRSLKRESPVDNMKQQVT